MPEVARCPVLIALVACGAPNEHAVPTRRAPEPAPTASIVVSRMTESAHASAVERTFALRSSAPARDDAILIGMRAGALSIAMLLFAACATKDDASFDVEASCRNACTPPAGTPCAGQAVPANCVEDCKARASARTGTCQQCLANTTGFRWTTCECSGPCAPVTDPLACVDPNGCKVCRFVRANNQCSSASDCTPGCGGFAFASATPVDRDAGGAGTPVPYDCSDSCR